MFGYGGKILKVDLSSGQIKAQTYTEDFARTFLGGNGFAAKLIYDGTTPATDPLGEENALVFTAGPLTDTSVWGSSRGHVAAISPQTGFFADSNYGGQFATAQKRTGFDVIYIYGKSPTPVYLSVTENGGELRDAGSLWGKTTEETSNILQEKGTQGAVAASIGPAGENGVVFANIICGGNRTGAAGRGGLGAVMGAKKLKAVVVSGQRKTKTAHPDELNDLLKDKISILKENTKALTVYGTPVLVKMMNEKGVLGTHNNSRETFEHAGLISGEVLKEKHVIKNTACYKCPVACGKQVKVTEGKFSGRVAKMPEYETIYAMGPMLDNQDIGSIINANALCDLLGIDTISMGVTLSFAAECLEKGIISEKDLGGKINFGNSGQIANLIKDTAARKGIGDLLAMGSEKLAQRFGPESKKYLHSVKGLEMAGHSARGVKSMSLGYATSTRGGSHHDTRPRYICPDEASDFSGQAEYNVHSQHFTAVGDSLIMCRFVVEKVFGSMLNDDIARVLNYVTGWDISLEELESIGERIYNLERLINAGRGLGRRDDILPYRVMNEPIPEGPSKGRYCSRQDLDKMLDEYYELRGWTEDGIPGDEKLAALGLK